MYLVPLVLIVTSGQRRGGRGNGGRDSWLRLLRMHPLAGPDGGIRTALARAGTTRAACVPETVSSWSKKKKKNKEAAGGGAIKQHISPNA